MILKEADDDSNWWQFYGRTARMRPIPYSVLQKIVELADPIYQLLREDPWKLDWSRQWTAVFRSFYPTRIGDFVNQFSIHDCAFSDQARNAMRWLSLSFSDVDFAGIRLVPEESFHIVAKQASRSAPLTFADWERLYNFVNGGVRTVVAHPRRAKSLQRLDGMVFTLTGQLRSLIRRQAWQEIVDRGGQVRVELAKSTNIVVTGEFPGEQKLKEAVRRRIRILDEREFVRMLKLRRSAERLTSSDRR